MKWYRRINPFFRVYIAIKIWYLSREPSLRHLATWHEECVMDMDCPFCGADAMEVKTNGGGCYRCRECDVRWFIMRATE